MLKEMGASSRDAEQYIHEREETLPRFGSAAFWLRLAHFFAQVLHESGCLRFDMERLNHSADGLPHTCPKYFTTREDVVTYARQPGRKATRRARRQQRLYY